MARVCRSERDTGRDKGINTSAVETAVSDAAGVLVHVTAASAATTAHAALLKPAKFITAPRPAHR
jgi:hypothetical protein